MLTSIDQYSAYIHYIVNIIIVYNYQIILVGVVNQMICIIQIQIIMRPPPTKKKNKNKNNNHY